MGSKGSSSKNSPPPPCYESVVRPKIRTVRQTSANTKKQWVEKVLQFSTQYDTSSWCADTVVGPPKVYPRYGDTPGAWASRTIDANQFLELQYKEPVYIDQINIYETYNAGGVKRVLARGDRSGDWHVLWKTDRVERIQRSRVFCPPINDLGMKCSEIRLEVDCSAAGTWVEIDAVEIVGVTTYLTPPPGMDELSSDLSILVNNETFCDIKFDIADRQMYAHKAILMARSDYFKAMFCDRMKESTTTEPISLPDVDYDGFYAALHYLYTNKIPSMYSPEQLVDVWRIADRFSIDGLKATAAFTVCNSLTDTNVVDVYCASTNTLPVIDDIRDSCLEYMRGHMSTVVKSPPFVDLPKDIMLEIIQLTNQMKIS